MHTEINNQDILLLTLKDIILNFPLQNEIKVKLVKQLDREARAVSGNESYSNLTKREKNIVEFVKNGYPNKSIAQQLELAESTVKCHIHNICKKWNVTNRTQIANKALKDN